MEMDSILRCQDYYRSWRETPPSFRDSNYYLGTKAVGNGREVTRQKRFSQRNSEHLLEVAEFVIEALDVVVAVRQMGGGRPAARRGETREVVFSVRYQPPLKLAC